MRSTDSGARAVPVSCYGKLPFHREYLRIDLGSPAAVWVVRWLEKAHEAISTGRYAVTSNDTGTLSFVMPSPNDGQAVVAGVVRQSSDGQRKHPVALFVEDRIADIESHWHLLPIALFDVWTMLRGLVTRNFRRMEDLTEALGRGIPAPNLADAEGLYRETLERRPRRGPWETLTGACDEAARHLALNLVAVGQAQREARGTDEGVALAIPLEGPGDAVEVAAAVWIELLRVVTGERPLPTILLGEHPRRLYTFYRPIDGTDLASLLAAAPDQLDDLSETWQTLPARDSTAGVSLERLVAPDVAPMAELVARLRALRVP